MTIWNMEITAAESPQTVHIPLEGKYYAIKNTGEHDILVSSYVVNPTEGEDDVMKIPSGGAAIIPVKDGDLYVSAEEDGAYSISIQDDKVIPWSGGTGSGGGGGDNTHYKGTTTTPISNGSTTNPITIDGESYTAVFGDVVVYGYTEFVFDGTAWSEFGRPFDTVPTSGSTNAVTSDGVYRNTAGQKYFVNGEYRGTVLSDYYCKATGNRSLAEGFNTTASGSFSHAEGNGSVASNTYSHAEGQSTKASGGSSHAEGRHTVASGAGSHTTGFYTIANKENSTAIGKYNVEDTDVAHLLIVGNGTAEDNRSNILEVSETDMNVNGDIQQNGVPLRATAMPTITASMLGKVVQYVGTSDSNYKQGWNYVAVSDGAETPTYSWQALMDTTPTSGSTNAVTSDGIYQRTPFKRGEGTESAVIGPGTTRATTPYSTAIGNNVMAYGGAHAFAIGNGTRAGNSNALATGFSTVASAFASSAFGSGTTANQVNMMAIGNYNSPGTNDLFNIGNGSSAQSRSNIVEVNSTSANVNGDIKIHDIAIPTPYTTMPTITADMLGKIAMYVGAIGNGYTQGCFYIASTDGAAEPTYSWVKIGSGRTETVLWENTGTTNPDTITLSESWGDFDEIVTVVSDTNQITTTNEATKHTSAMVIGKSIALWYNSESTWGTYTIASSTVFTKISSGGSYHIKKIIGIKY